MEVFEIAFHNIESSQWAEQEIRSRVAVASRYALPKSQTGCGSAANAGAAITINKKMEKTGDLGFEPRQTDPESVVLPLHQSPITYTTL